MPTTLLGDPSIGIVIPACDAQAYLATTLQSVCLQTRQDWACVVVDDDSIDRTVQIARRWAGCDPRIRLICLPRRGGPSAARNVGLAALPSSCHRVMFLDADDLLFPSALADLDAALSGRGEASGVSGLAEYIDDAGHPVAPGDHPVVQQHRVVYRGLRRITLKVSDDATEASLLVLNTIWPPATALLRREAVHAVAGWDTNLNSQEDWDFFLRVSAHGPISFLPEQVAWYRRHVHNQSRRTLDYVRNVIYIRRKAWRAARGVREHVSAIRAHLDFLAWILVSGTRSIEADLRVGNVLGILSGLAWVTASFVALILLVPIMPPRRLVSSLLKLDQLAHGRSLLDSNF